MSLLTSIGGALLNWVTSDNSDSSLKTAQSAMTRATSSNFYTSEQMGPTKVSSGKIPQIMQDTLRQAAKMNNFSISEASLARGMLEKAIRAQPASLGNIKSAGSGASRTKSSMVGKNLAQKGFS